MSTVSKRGSCELCAQRVQDVFEMKYAHTPMETSASTPAPRSEAVSKPDVTKTSAAQGRKDATGDGGGDESEEEREKRLHELQDQVN